MIGNSGYEKLVVMIPNIMLGTSSGRNPDTKSKSVRKISVLECWRPQGDSNPRYRRERAMS